jgi:predicted RNA-binding Zn-ribbon protein involved in translation (DUF1610 family)
VSVHVTVARVIEARVVIVPCPTCERRRRMWMENCAWYGPHWTCLSCGDSWQDGERLMRPFARGWRQQSIAAARRRMEHLRERVPARASRDQFEEAYS